MGQPQWPFFNHSSFCPNCVERGAFWIGVEENIWSHSASWSFTLSQLNALDLCVSSFSCGALWLIFEVTLLVIISSEVFKYFKYFEQEVVSEPLLLMSKLASALDASNFPGKLGKMWKFTFLEIFPKKEGKRECRQKDGSQKYLGIF